MERSNHVVVLGYGYLTRPLLNKLGDRSEYVVVTTEPDMTRRLRDRGYDVEEFESVNEEALKSVGLEEANAVVVASESDADDALSVLTARGVNPSVEIIAVASNSENSEKLRRAGADIVVSPADIVGKLLAESALTGEDTEVILEKLHERITERAE